MRIYFAQGAARKGDEGEPSYYPPPPIHWLFIGALGAEGGLPLYDFVNVIMQWVLPRDFFLLLLVIFPERHNIKI